jgi:hypothetical protein
MRGLVFLLCKKGKKILEKKERQGIFIDVVQARLADLVARRILDWGKIAEVENCFLLPIFLTSINQVLLV